MRLDEFDYDLPPEAIAQTPVEPRDSARLIVDRGETVEHRRVSDLASLLRPGDLVVVNDTRVVPARLRLHRAGGGAAEVLVLAEREPGTWEALVRPGRKLRPGTTLYAPDGSAVVEVGERTPAGVTVLVRMVDAAALDRYGEMPLPPYITEPLVDPERYQTVYARRRASAAAPTAGLHLTQGVFDSLAAAGIDVATVELAVGLDTFAPVTAVDPLDHPMHTERYSITPEVWERVGAAGRVVAIGTTTVRALESAAATGRLGGDTALFIHRGYEFAVVDVLMTNFHMPRTTLLMMLDAFCGPRWRALYAEAMARGYRFLSFGDAMLVERQRAGTASLPGQ